MESGPLAVAEPAAVEPELGHRDTAGAVLDRAAQEQCRVDSDWEASVLVDTLLGRRKNSPSAEEAHSLELDIGQRVELVVQDIVHIEARSSDFGVLALDMDRAELDTAGSVEVGRTSGDILADRADFVADNRDSEGRLFVDRAVAVMENFVVAVADWELEKWVVPVPIQMRWEFELDTAGRGPVEIDSELAMWVGLAPIPWRLEFELCTADRELEKSAVLDWVLEDRFAQFVVDFGERLAELAAVAASGWVLVDH